MREIAPFVWKIAALQEVRFLFVLNFGFFSNIFFFFFLVSLLCFGFEMFVC